MGGRARGLWGSAGKWVGGEEDRPSRTYIDKGEGNSAEIRHGEGNEAEGGDEPAHAGKIGTETGPAEVRFYPERRGKME